MSYGNVYIQEDIKGLKADGRGKEEILDIIAGRIHSRYPDISLPKARVIAQKNYEGRKTTRSDWR